jgi:hypothetical protein
MESLSIILLVIIIIMWIIWILQIRMLIAKIWMRHKNHEKRLTPEKKYK